MRRLIQATVCQGACLTGHHVGMQESHPPAGPVTLCVLLWARPGTEGGLIAYEDQVLDIASGYGGRVLQRARSGGGDGQPLEIQLPSSLQHSHGEFMTDGRRQGLAGERDRVVARTEVIDVQLIGRDPGEVWLCCPCRVHDDLARAASCHAEFEGVLMPYRVVVVGAGFGGLGLAIALGRAGGTRQLLEKDGDLGGTWRDNSYPGAACDVPSHLYSFSFEPNPTGRGTTPQARRSWPTCDAAPPERRRATTLRTRSTRRASTRRALWRVDSRRGAGCRRTCS